jgi:hypothetical protein
MPPEFKTSADSFRGPSRDSAFELTVDHFLLKPPTSPPV